MRRFAAYYYPGVPYSDAAKRLEKLGAKFQKQTSSLAGKAKKEAGKLAEKGKQEGGKLAEKGKSGIKSLGSKFKSSLPTPSKPKLPLTSSVGKTMSSAANSVAKAPQNVAKQLFGKKR